MSQLQRFEKDGYLVYLAKDGRVFYPQTTLVKLMGIDNKALTRILKDKSVRDCSPEFPELHPNGWLQLIGKLVDSSDLKTIIQAYVPTLPSQKAKKEKIVDALMGLGSLGFAYQLAGYTPDTRTRQQLLVIAITTSY